MEPTHRNISEISIDKKNPRTIEQDNEKAAVHAMISLKPEYFWGLTDSLIQDNYIPTESLVLHKVGKREVLREGNRRAGALKLIHGLIPLSGLPVPEAIENQITAIPDEWKEDNKIIPCLLFEESEAEMVEKIVSRIHGRGEKARRLDWNSIARARHNRKKGNPEPGLELLEQFLEKGRNITKEQREEWAADYPLTVLNDALGKISAATGFATGKLPQSYSKIRNLKGLQNILYDIGMARIGFSEVRDKLTNFTVAYGFSAPVPASNPTPGTGTSTNPTLNVSVPELPAPASLGSPKRSLIARPLNDAKTVKRALRKFAPRGKGREKLASLLDEAISVNIGTCPLCFCFLLRCMFELSAKAYADDHKIPLVKNGKDKPLADLLLEIKNHLTLGLGQRDPTMKALTGAMTELKDPHGVLSVGSLNGIVHWPNFTLDEKHICGRFHNVFPMLRDMNK